MKRWNLDLVSAVR